MSIKTTNFHEWTATIFVCPPEIEVIPTRATHILIAEWNSVKNAKLTFFLCRPYDQLLQLLQRVCLATISATLWQPLQEIPIQRTCNWLVEVDLNATAWLLPEVSTECSSSFRIPIYMRLSRRWMMASMIWYQYMMLRIRKIQGRKKSGHNSTSGDTVDNQECKLRCVERFCVEGYKYPEKIGEG